MDKTSCFFVDAASALFRAKDKHSNQEKYFDTSQEAFEWMFFHRDWILSKREIVNWTFPLEQIVSKEYWVKIEQEKDRE